MPSKQLEALLLSSPAGAARLLSDGLYQVPLHIKYLNRKLLKIHTERNKRYLIMMPPRHGKTMLVSKYTPAWYLGLNPEHHAMLTSYGQTLATKNAKFVRDLLRDYGYQYWGIRLDESSRAKQRFQILGGGGMESAGIQGAITGSGANLGIVDDPIKNIKEAFSEVFREAVWGWYQSTFYTRLEPMASIIVMLTRWHEDDLAGRLIEAMLKGKGDEWEIIKLPAIALENDPLGRKPGEALWPERYPIERLKQIREVIGSYLFNALYQQDPEAEGGNIIKEAWIQRWRELPRIGLIRVVQIWDTGYKKDSPDNSPSCCQTWAEYPSGYYLVDQYKERLEWPDLRSACIDEYNKAREITGIRLPKPSAVVVEDEASGQSLIQDIKRDRSLGIPIVPIKPEGLSKELRLHTASPSFEAGNVWVPEVAPWVADYVKAIRKAPAVKFWEEPDCTAYAIIYFKSAAPGKAGGGYVKGL